MWRDTDESAVVESGRRRRPRIAFEPDWMAERSPNGKSSTNAKHHRRSEEIDYLLVNPPSDAFFIVDSWTGFPPSREPQAGCEPYGVIEYPTPLEYAPADAPPQVPPPDPASVRVNGHEVSARRSSATVVWPLLIASGLMSFLCGGLAVALYDRSVAKAENPSASALSDQMARFERRLNELKEPAAAPDLQPIRSELKDLRAALDEMKQDQFKELRVAIDEMKKETLAVQSLRSRVDELKVDLDVRRASADDKLKTQKDDASYQETGAAQASGYVPSSMLKRGTELFNEGDGVKARDLFRVATEVYPSDARLWYYSALSEMRSTGVWPGTGEPLFRKGIECEQAGKPPGPEIDAAFASLSKAQGRDWLNYYRSIARGTPAQTAGP